MRDQPTGEQLLAAARDLLRDEVLPILPGDKRHGALMIANVMAIAMRLLHSGDEPEQHELDALKKILPTHAGGEPAGANGPVMQALIDANRSLCRMLREGGADSGELHDRVWQHLLGVTRHRVSISNPKYLEGNA